MIFRTTKKLLAAMLTVLVLTGPVDPFPSSAMAQEITAPEYEIKAAFLYNFAKLTEWPPEAFPDATTSFTVGVLGNNPFDSELAAVFKDKTIAGRPINIVRFRQSSEVKDCQLLFIAKSESDHLPLTLKRLAERPILTVSDADGFARSGGIIGLLKRGPEIRFEINRVAASRAKLKLSSKMLRLAENILPVPPEQEGRQ